MGKDGSSKDHGGDERLAALGHMRIGWKFFGSELKRWREAAGLTQQQLGERVFVSGAYIGQFETAIRKPQVDIAERIDAELGTGGFLARMCAELINSSQYDSYFAPVAELEQYATSISEYAPTFIPGLLQTPHYIRALTAPFVALKRWPAPDAVLAVRRERAKLLDKTPAPIYWVVLHETILRVPVGGPAVMAEQLTHIAEMAKRDRIVVQVLPFSAGASALASAVMLMAFDDAPPMSYTEAQNAGMLLDDPATVSLSQLAYDVLRAASLSPEASLRLIESAAEEYTRCTSSTT
jgi:transcriptional regulator with XRE-family HTH domain